jgi:predicted MFS family arabinose efflux permease
MVSTETQVRPRLGLLMAASAAMSASIGVLFSLIADIQDRYGFPTWGLGVMTAAAFFTGVVVQLIVAPLADRGHARTLLLVGLALDATTLLWLAASTKLWEFIAARAVLGVAAGLFVPACRALVAGSDPERVGERLGQLASRDLAGFTVAPIVGALMASHIGLKSPFVACAAVEVVALIGLSRRSIPALPHDADARPSLALLADPAVRAAALMTLALFLPVGVYDSLWARYLTDRGASTLFVGTSLALYTVPFILLASRGGRFADKIGPRRAVLSCLFAIVPVVVLYGVLTAPILIATVGVIDAVGQAVATPGAQAAMARACPPGKTGAGQGLAGAMGLAGAGLASVIAAPVYSAFGSVAVFGGTAATIAAIGLVAARTAV